MNIKRVLVCVVFAISAVTAMAGPYRTVLINSGPSDVDFTLTVSPGYAVEIVNFVSGSGNANSADLYVSFKTSALRGLPVKFLTAAMGPASAGPIGLVISARSATNAQESKIIDVHVADGDTALLTYKLLAN